MLSFKQIGTKEARVWLLLSCLVAPLVLATSSHIGFVIGGWVAYQKRSVAIYLLYLFIFIFMYGSLQYMYMFPILVNWCKKRSCFRIEAVELVYYHHLEQRTRIDDPDDGQIMHTKECWPQI